MFRSSGALDGGTASFGIQLAEQCKVTSENLVHSDCQLRAIGHTARKVLGLLSKNSQTSANTEFWVCELEQRYRTDFEWRHLRRLCCGRIMQRLTIGENSCWYCHVCFTRHAFDPDQLGPADFQLSLDVDVRDASYLMTVDASDGAWVFIDDGRNNLCWHVSADKATQTLSIDGTVHCLSTAYSVSPSEIYIQFGFEECIQGVLSKEAVMTLNRWPQQVGRLEDSSERLMFDCTFRGRLLSLSQSLLVGLADNGLWALRLPSVPLGSGRPWEKVMDLPEDERGAELRVLSCGPEKDQVVIFGVTTLDGILQPAHFLRPTHVVQLKVDPNHASSSAPGSHVSFTVQKLSSLVVLPVHGATVYQHRRCTNDTMWEKAWNSSILPLAVRETCATKTFCPSLGRSFLLFDYSGHAYRIWDEEVLPAGDGWQPPTLQFDPMSRDVVFSLNCGEVGQLKSPLEPLLRYEYFKALFKGWREGQLHEVVVQGVKLDTFREMLRFIHTGRIANASLGSLIETLQVASKYMIADLVAMLLRQLRLALADHNTVRMAEPEDLCELLLSAEVIGCDGIGLTQDAAAAILDHRPSLLQDAKFMTDLARRSATTFSALMSALLNCSSTNRARLFQQQIAAQIVPVTKAPSRYGRALSQPSVAAGRSRSRSRSSVRRM